MIPTQRINESIRPDAVEQAEEAGNCGQSPLPVLVHGADGAHEFGEVFAVAGSLIEQLQSRVSERFG